MHLHNHSGCNIAGIEVRKPFCLPNTQNTNFFIETLGKCIRHYTMLLFAISYSVCTRSLLYSHQFLFFWFPRHGRNAILSCTFNCDGLLLYSRRSIPDYHAHDCIQARLLPAINLLFGLLNSFIVTSKLGRKWTGNIGDCKFSSLDLQSLSNVVWEFKMRHCDRYCVLCNNYLIV